jgi:hypothetical protein
VREGCSESLNNANISLGTPVKLRDTESKSKDTLWTPLRVNNTNISGELPHSPGILMNTG